MNILIVDPEKESLDRLIVALKPHQNSGDFNHVKAVSKSRALDEANNILLHNPDINCIFIDVINLDIEKASKFIFNLRNKIPQIVFVLYNNSDEVEKIGDDFYFGERIRFRHYFLLNKKSIGEKLERKLAGVVHLCISDLRLQTSFERQRLLVVSNKTERLPVEISESLELFRRQFEGLQTAFIMMSFDNTLPHMKIANAIKSALKDFGIIGLRSDDYDLNDNLYDNIRTYMHGCDIGISVYEAINNQSINANISFETGYMKALGKPVCIMKDKSMPYLQADLLGKLYIDIDTHNIEQSIEDNLKKWIGRKLTSWNK